MLSESNAPVFVFVLPFIHLFTCRSSCCSPCGVICNCTYWSELSVLWCCDDGLLFQPSSRCVIPVLPHIDLLQSSAAAMWDRETNISLPRIQWNVLNVSQREAKTNTIIVALIVQNCFHLKKNYLYWNYRNLWKL